MKTIARNILRTLRSKFKTVSKLMATDQLLTKSLTKQRVFKEDPFFLLDVGSSGGISYLWDLFGEDFSGYGFDPLVNECDRLNQLKKHPNFEYISSLVIAGKPEIDQLEHIHYWFPRSSAAKTQKDYVKEVFNRGQKLVYSKEKTTLDQFCEIRKITKVDFVKIDTDKSDYKVLRGGESLFSQETTLGALIECNYSGDPGPYTNCFRNIEGLLAEKGYRVFDMDINRYSKHHLPANFQYNLDAQTVSGQACWGDVLFLRDFVEMKEKGVSVSPHSLLKMACIMEMFNLPDCAAELLQTFKEELSPFIDHQKSLDLLAQDLGLFDNYETHLSTFKFDSKTFYPE